MSTIPSGWKSPPLFQWGGVAQVLAVHEIVIAAGNRLKADFLKGVRKPLVTYGSYEKLKDLTFQGVRLESNAVKLQYGPENDRATVFVSEVVFKEVFNDLCVAEFTDYRYLRLL